MADAASDAGPCHAGHSPARVNSIPISYSTESLLSKAASTARLEAAAARSPATLKRRLDSEGTFAYARRRCVCSLSRLPVQASAIALNVAAISGMLDLLVKAKGSRQRFLLPLSNMLCVEATLLVGLYLLRALCSRDLMRELSSRTVVSSHSVCLTTVQVLLSSPGSARQMGGALASGLAAMVANASGAINLCLTGRFLYLCWLRKGLVEPSWFPATVSVAAISHVGPAVGTPPWVRLGALIAGCIATAVLWPPCVYRALRYPRHVACNPSIFVLMAPIPFLTMAMFRSRAEEHTPLLGPVGMDAFFLLNCVNVVLCLCCALQRWRVLCGMLRPMDPRWSALTFPLVSTGSVALYYANEYAFLPSSESQWTARASEAWSYVLVPLTLVLVPACDLAWMCHLPNWCCFNPPPRIDSLNDGLDQLIDSGGDAENGVRTASRIPGHVEGLEAGVEVQDWGSHGPHT
jgi:hypothetical protein